MEGCDCTTETISAWTSTMISLYSPFLFLGFLFHLEASFYQLCVSLVRATNISENFSLILQNINNNKNNPSNK